MSNKSLIKSLIFLICEIMLMIAFTFATYIYSRSFNTSNLANVFIWLIKDIVVYSIMIIIFKVKIVNNFKGYIKFKPLLMTLLAAIGYIIIVNAIMNLLGKILPNWSFYDYINSLMGGKHMGFYTIPYLFILTVIIAPFLEEVIYRGYILNLLLKGCNKAIKPIVVSALIFGLIHLSILGSINGFIFGIVSGTIYYKYRNLKYNVLLHSLINLVTYMSLIINLF